MKAFKHTALALFIFLSLGVLLPHDSLALNALVRYVIDGDTIVLSNGIRVRYLGINAPEIPHKDQRGEPFGIEAWRRNKELVLGRVVRLEYGPNRRDRFGRLLAFVFLRDGRMVNEMLVKEGLAFVCIFNKRIPYKERLISAQRSAIIQRRGLWSVPPEHPEPYYIGNKRTLRFHRPGCPYAKRIWKGNRIIFKDRISAYMQGFCRCKKCLP